MLLRGWRRTLFNIGAALVLLWIALGIIATRVSRAALSDEQANLTLEFATYEADFTRDIDAMARNPLFAPRDGGDASSLLFAHVRWEQWDGAATVPIRPPPIPVPFESDLQRWGTEWTTHFDDDRLDGLDLSWLSTLKGDGYWDLEPVGASLDGVSYGLLYGLGPRFSDLSLLAKTRLLLGLRRGEQIAAGAEVRDLARLALTTETFVGMGTAVGLLRLEEAAWERANLRGLEVSGWTPVRAAEREQLLRAGWAAISTRGLLAVDPVSKKEVGIFRCTALAAGLDQSHFLSRYLQRPLRERYAELDAELSRSQCRLRQARRNQHDPDASERFPVSLRAFCGPGTSYPPCQIPDLPLSWLPLVRLPLGTKLLVDRMGHVDGFRLYREFAARPSPPPE